MAQKYTIEGMIQFKDQISKGLEKVSTGLQEMGENMKQAGYEATRVSEVLDSLENGLEQLAIFAGVPLVMALEDAREYNDELAKSFAVLSANSKVVINEIGNMLIPMFRQIAGVATRASKAFLDMSDELKTVVKYVMMFAVSTVAIAGVISVISRIARAVAMLRGAFMMLQGELLKFLVATNPLFLAAIVIFTAFAAAYIANVGHVREGTKIVVGVFQDLWNAVKVFFAAISGFIGSIFGQVEEDIRTFQANITETISGLAPLLSKIMLRIGHILGTIKDLLVRNISFGEAKELLAADLAEIKEEFSNFGRHVKKKAEKIGNDMKSPADMIKDAWADAVFQASKSADEWVGTLHSSGASLDELNAKLDRLVTDAKKTFTDLNKPFDEAGFWKDLLASNPQLAAMLQKMSEFDDRLKGLLGNELGLKTFSEGWKKGFREMAKEMTDWSTLGQKVAQDLSNSINTVLGDTFFNILTRRFEDMKDVFKSFGEALLRTLGDVLARIVMVKAILEPLIKANPELAPFFNVVNPGKGAQAGINTVPVTGIYQLHRGERVMTHGGGGGGQQVVVNMTVQSWDAQDVWRNREALGAAVGAQVRANGPLRNTLKANT